MKNVVLEYGEIEIAKSIGKARYLVSRKNGVFDRLVGDGWEDPIQNDIDAFGAEVAYCKAFNLYPDLTLNLRSGGHDAIHGGRTVDVKHTPHVNGRLLVTKTKAHEPTQVYALVTGRLPNYVIVGYANRDEIFTDNNLLDLGFGESYGLTQDKLHEYNN